MLSLHIQILSYISLVSIEFYILIQKKFQGIFLSCIILLTISVSCSKNVSSEDKPTVYIAEDKGQYQLIRNGVPFYIKGGAASADYLEELKEAGANTARIYDTINLDRVLQRAEALGLAVVVDIPLPKFYGSSEYYENEKLFEAIKQRIEPVIRKHKDHPALLYWNLGNELYYPYFYTNTTFFKNFNSLIDLVHEVDPNHPVSTTTIGANKLRVISIKLRSPQLDFISFNSFGVLSTFHEKLRPIEPFWNGPYVITEWGVNGPWEATNTSWGAPIEETSDKKAAQIVQRYYDYMLPLKEENNLGSFVFYWGQKFEITPTWYSLFDKEKKKSRAVFELKNIWTEIKEEPHYPGPKLTYLLLDEEGAQESIIRSPNQKLKVETVLPEEVQPELSYSWELREEAWLLSHKGKLLATTEFQKSNGKVSFNAPSKEGAYRIYLKLTNNSDYYATANIPFYVLNPENEE